MLKNNNQKVISAMAVHVIKRNKRRYGILVTAVMLSAFMVFSTLTVGETYFKMKRQQELRMHGADFDAVVGGGVVEGQKEICEKNPNIQSVGMGTYAGFTTAMGEYDNARSGLVWCDEVHWEEQRKPVMEWVKGSYPQKENELMVNAKTMKKYGLGELDIGDSFNLTFSDYQSSHTKTFYITGIFSDYSSDLSFFVSEAFYRNTGYQLDYDGMLYLKFKTPYISRKSQETLAESLQLGKRQRFIMMADTEKSTGILAGLVGLVLFTCLSAYLLIYNILYLSVAGNIRYYGVLQTVGMTEEQIRMFWRKQMLFLGGMGIGSGTLLAAGISFFIIPEIVKTFGIRESIEVTFHPLVLLLSAAVAGTTVWLGSRKAVKTAVTVTPVEALSYQVDLRKSPVRRRHSKHRNAFLWRMALGQMGKDKKKSLIVILSLSAAMSVFLCMTALIASHGPRTLVTNYMDSDFEIRNDTLYSTEEEKWRQIMDASFIQDLENIKGINEIHLLLGAKIIVPWEPDFSDMWMREYYETWVYYQSYDEVLDEYKQQPENFYTFIKGVDKKEFEQINSTLETPADKKQFEEGRTCFLYKDDLSFDMTTLKNKTVKYYFDEAGEELYQMQIAGQVDNGYYGGIRGYGPILIVSDSFLKRIVEEPYVCKAAISYTEVFDEKTEEEVREHMNASPYAKEFSYDSKLENMLRIKKAQGNMQGVGLGVTLILVMIGLLNYVNTVFANIQNRQMSLAVMESVGMTGRQVKGMLIREGLLFAAGALLITATVGTAVTYICYQSMNYMRVPFQIPLLPVMLAAIMSVLLCVAVPLLSCRVIAGKSSLAERIRGLGQ